MFLEYSEYDVLLKPVVVADFIDDRERLEEFSNVLTECSTKSRHLPKEPEVTKPPPAPTTVIPEPEQPAPPNVIEEDFEQAKRVFLDSNDKLARIYSSLVVSEEDSEGLISSKDFWEHHKTELKTNVSQLKGKNFDENNL